MNMIFIWLATIITFLLGYALGKGTLTVTTYQAIKKELQHKVYPHFTQPSGVISRPSASRINEINHPEIEQEKAEMAKVMQEGVEPLTTSRDII